MPAGPPSDRRRAPRSIACFLAFVEHETPGAPDAKETALIADVAPTGARLFVSGAALRVGEPVRLELLIDTASERVRMAAGRVVRVEPLPAERVLVWTHQVGVEFDSPLTLDDEEKHLIREQCERIGLRR
jgi:hypothetical protein